MKTHKTWILTARRLKGLDACSDGFEAARRLLPAKLSTDPSDNLRLAIAVVDANADINWLRVKLSVHDRLLCFHPDSCSCRGPAVCPWRRRDDRVMIAQQWLAWIADKMLTKEGK